MSALNLYYYAELIFGNNFLVYYTENASLDQVKCSKSWADDARLGEVVELLII